MNSSWAETASPMPRPAKTRRIAVYSGSFDPLHIGHLSILRLLSARRRFDTVLLILSPQSPFKEAEKAENAPQRLEAARDAVARHPELKRVQVDDIELRMPPPQYTIRTLDALRERDPQARYTLVIGGDNLDSFRRWRDYRRILLEYGVLVYPRQGFDSAALRASLLEEDSAYRIELLDAPLVDISSTRIREGLSKGEDMSGYLM